MGLRDYLRRFFMTHEDYETWLSVHRQHRKEDLYVLDDTSDQKVTYSSNPSGNKWKDRLGPLTSEEIEMSGETTVVGMDVGSTGATLVETKKPLEQTIPQLDLVPIVLNLDYELSVTSSILNILLHRFIMGQEGQKEMMGVVGKIRDEVAKNIKAKYPTLNLVFETPTAPVAAESQAAPTVQ